MTKFKYTLQRRLLHVYHGSCFGLLVFYVNTIYSNIETIDTAVKQTVGNC